MNCSFDDAELVTVKWRPAEEVLHACLKNGIWFENKDDFLDWVDFDDDWVVVPCPQPQL